MSYEVLREHRLILRDTKYGISKGALLIFDAEEETASITIQLGLDRYDYELDKDELVLFAQDVIDIYA